MGPDDDKMQRLAALGMYLALAGVGLVGLGMVAMVWQGLAPKVVVPVMGAASLMTGYGLGLWLRAGTMAERYARRRALVVVLGIIGGVAFLAGLGLGGYMMLTR